MSCSEKIHTALERYSDQRLCLSWCKQKYENAEIYRECETQCQKIIWGEGMDRYKQLFPQLYYHILRDPLRTKKSKLS